MNENVGERQYRRQLNKLVGALKSMTHVVSRGLFKNTLLKLEWVVKDDAGFFSWKAEEWKVGSYNTSNLRMSDFEINSASVIITDRENQFKTIFIKI